MENRLAHFARCNNYDVFSLDETLVIIQDVLYDDFCNNSFVAQNSGYMSLLREYLTSINEIGRGANGLSLSTKLGSKPL